MPRLICVFVIHIGIKQVFWWCGSFASGYSIFVSCALGCQSIGVHFRSDCWASTLLSFLKDSSSLLINQKSCSIHIWTVSSEFIYRLCEQRRFRRACASTQSRQNLRCSLIQAVSQKEPSDRKPDPWPLWMAGHAQLKFVITECSKTQIRLTGLIWTTDSPNHLH